MSFINLRPSRWHLAGAILALSAGMLAAQSSGSSGSGCTPEGQWLCTAEVSHGNGAPLRDGVDVTSGNYTPRDWDIPVDSGRAVDQETGVFAPPFAPPMPEKRHNRTKAAGFAWAEDDETTTVSIDASTERVHVFQTICRPAQNHLMTPPGGTKHTVTAKAEISWDCMGNAGPGSRACSLTTAVELPTGDSLSNTVTIDDTSTVSGTTVIGGTVNIEVGGTTNVIKEKGGESGKVDEEKKIGIDAKIRTKKWINWTQSAAKPSTNVVWISGKSVFETRCHASGKDGLEKTHVLGSGTVTARGDAIMSIQLKGTAESVVMDTMEPLNQCGQPLVVVPPETPPSGGQTGVVPPTPGGGEMPESSSGPITSSQARPCVVSTMNEPGMATAFAWAAFHATLKNGGAGMTRSVTFRVAPTSVANVVMTAVAVAWPVTEFTIGAPVVFDPYQPHTLSEGEWEIVVGVIPLAVGRGDIQMSFDPLYLDDKTVTARIEVVSQPFSIIGFDEGDHSSADPAAREIQMWGPGARIGVETLFTNSIGLGIPTMTYTVTSGGPVVWMKAPQMEFDLQSHTWYLAMAPQSACTLNVTITFAGQSLTFPVVWKDGVPNS